MIRTFFTTVAVGSLFVGGLAASHLAFADPGADGPRGPRGGGGMMMMADADTDGKITKAELTTALDARFAKMDANRDGKLDKADRDMKRAQRLDARFTALDTDRNGQISKAEFTAGHQRAGAGPEAGKPDGPDGKRWGGRHHGGHGGPGMWGGGFGRGEAMKDGVVTRAEFVAGATAMFDKADANKDGAVTRDEMRTARQAMRGNWGDRRGGPNGPPPPPAD